MGDPKLGYSLVQLRLDNQDKVQLIGCVSNMVLDFKGMRTRVDFDVIKVVDGGESYPVLLGI